VRRSLHAVFLAIVLILCRVVIFEIFVRQRAHVLSVPDSLWRCVLCGISNGTAREIPGMLHEVVFSAIAIQFIAVRLDIWIAGNGIHQGDQCLSRTAYNRPADSLCTKDFRSIIQTQNGSRIYFIEATKSRSRLAYVSNGDVGGYGFRP
jgi:hypothetical protein